jgi:hypothetical protein
MEAGRAAVQDLPGVAQNLGYHDPLTRSQYVALAWVEDVLAPAGRPREVRKDLTPLPSRNPAPAPTHRGLDRAPDERADAAVEHYEPTLPQPSPYAVEQDEGLLAGPRRLTNRAFEALGEVGDWMLGRRY